MARISSYPKDSTIQDKDAWIGTESTNRVTRNFTAEDVANYVVTSTSAVTGSGTFNTIPLWTPDGTKLGDSIITQAASGQGVTVTGQLDVTQDFNVTGSTELFSTLSVQGASTFNNVSFQGVVFDGGGNPGTAGQVLSSTGTGVAWIAGDTNTTYDLTGAVSGAGDYKVVLTGSDGTIDDVTFKAGAGIILADQGTNTVQIQATNSGTVTGTGTTNTLPIWSDGPNGVLGDSVITQDLGNSVEITTGIPAGANCDYRFGVETFSGQKVGTTAGFEFKTGGLSGGYYKSGNFRFENKLAVGRNFDPSGATLDVGNSTDAVPAAYFRNGVVVSNNPSGVQVDNTSMVIGGGNNDVVAGSDNCLAVGNNNQILSDSDNSLAVGQGNIIRNNSDNCFAVGQNNIIDGSNTGTNSVRSQVLGFDNSLSDSYSSFIAGGNNTVTTGNNAFALGYSHNLQGIDSQFAFGENCNGPASGQNTFMMGSALTGSDKSMAVGFRNDTSSYPAIDYPNGLGETKFVVGVGSNSTSNAIIITEGGVNRGNPNIEQIPRIILPQQETLEFASDTDATAGGIPTGGLYRNGNDLKINFNETAAGGNEGLAYLTPQLLTASATGSGNVDPSYNLVLLSWTGGNGTYTLNLPLASANTNRLIRITTDGTLNSGANDKIDITATGGETIDGNPSFQISKSYEGVAVYSTGSEWIVIQAKAH